MLSQLFEGRFSPRGCKEGRRVIIGISKGGGEEELLPVEVFRAADVVMFTDGVAFLYFPSVPSEFYRTNT